VKTCQQSWASPAKAAEGAVWSFRVALGFYAGLEWGHLLTPTYGSRAACGLCGDQCPARFAHLFLGRSFYWTCESQMGL